jgi:beta-glucanase (GH16 family)
LFLNNWVPQVFAQNNYAGAGSNVSMKERNISFPINPGSGVPCLCETLHQPAAGVSDGAEILSAPGLFSSFGLGGYGTYEFCARFASTSPTPDGPGLAVSGGVSSTFLLSQNNPGGAGYVEIDAPEVEGQHQTWAEYDVWYNSDSGGNTEPTGPGIASQGAGNDSYAIVPTLTSAFHYYGFVWSPTKIDFYIDGRLYGTLAKAISPGTGGDIPGIDCNHYGTNSGNWGGSASVGITRYSYIASVKFWKA